MAGNPEVGHIFLSYSRQDAEAMRRVRDDLRAQGFAVWTDETGLEPGPPGEQPQP